MIKNQLNLPKPIPPRLILIRGLPGSGKSTRAKQICNEIDAIHFETDMYFIDSEGKYNFDANKLPQAHLWCQQQVEAALAEGKSVVVSNTFVRHWEMKAYQILAKRYDIAIEVQTCTGRFQNIHKVPTSVIQSMQKRWQN